MATPNTPNLNLNMFDDTEQFLATEVNANSTILDTAIPAEVVTSGSLPTANLFEGKRVRESDTGRILEYRNNVWQDVSSGMLMDYTSTTRPVSNLTTGMLIHETDTGNVMRYNGTGWDYVANSSNKRIFIATGLTATTDANGYATFNHGAPFTPTVCQVIIAKSAMSVGYLISVNPATATTVQARFGAWNAANILGSTSLGSGAITIISYE